MIMLGFLGLAVGSFLNVGIDRIPRGQSLIRPPSRCDHCHHRLGIVDLVPVLSYVWLRGKCRYCGTGIPLRLPMVELASGAIFTFIGYKYGVSPETGILLLYSSILILIFFIDLYNGLILNKLIYPSILFALALSPFWSGLGVEGATDRLLNSLLGGGISFGILLVIYLLSRGGMGGGDVKLAVFLGLITGYPVIFVTLLISFLAGGMMASALLLMRVKRVHQAIPFGPFMATSALAALFWGQRISDWYWGLF
ncbi:MAG: prepilin peptidase [Dehalococcoidia bacterium]